MLIDAFGVSVAAAVLTAGTRYAAHAAAPAAAASSIAPPPRLTRPWIGAIPKR